MLSTHSDESMATGMKSCRTSSDQDIFPLIHSRDIPRLQSALSHALNLNFRDSNSRTPLMHAILISDDLVRIQVIRLLLRHGCDVNAQDEAGRTVLMYACMHIDKIQARQLAKCRNCDPNVYDVDGNTALMHCVRKGNASAIKVLTNHANIQHRVRVNVVNRSGHSALEMAIHLGLKECCRILLKDGGADKSRIKHHSRLFLKSIEEEAFCSDPPDTSSCSTAHSRQSNLNPTILKGKGLCYTSNDKTVILASSAFDQSFRNRAKDEVFLDNNSGSSPHLYQDNTDAFTLSMPGCPHCS